MVQEPSFTLDEEGKYMCLDTARIITGKDLDILLAVMNSKLFFYAIKTFYGGGGLGEKGVRMKHTFFERFPMPSFSKDKKAEIKMIMKSLNTKNISIIDSYICNYYGLNVKEVNIIESQ